MEKEILDQIISAYKENEQDMKRAIREDDFEEQAMCKGYEMAMDYVLSLFNINVLEV